VGLNSSPLLMSALTAPGLVMVFVRQFPLVQYPIRSPVITNVNAGAAAQLPLTHTERGNRAADETGRVQRRQSIRPASRTCDAKYHPDRRRY
jgi:hypothetical protein